MRRLMSVVSIFFKRNVKKFMPSVITLVTFIVVLNIVMGILLETTGVMKQAVTQNASMYLMEIVIENNESEDNLVSMIDEINKIEYVASACMDLSHPINAVNSKSGKNEVFNILGINKKALHYFGIENCEKDSFFYIENKFLDTFPVDSMLTFDEGEYYIENNELKSRVVYYDAQVSGGFTSIGDDFFPKGLALIDSKTSLKIAKGMSPDGKIKSNRIIVIIPDVSKMKLVEQNIQEKYDFVSIHYSLKNAKELPSYSKVLITVGSIIIGILFLLSIFNLNGSVKQILSSRSRDIALFQLFGVKKNKIKKIFLLEFILYSAITFVVTIIIVTSLLESLKICFGFDIISKYYCIYFVIDFVMSIFIFGTLSLIHIATGIKSSSGGEYKEMLK